MKKPCSLTKDLNKNITKIEYNVLNLPCKITFGDGNSVCLYAADGRKLQSVHAIGGVTTTTDYVGDIIYENGALKRILVDGGYYENDEYYFYLKDHLGNNRVVAKEDGVVEERSDYYPFGGLMASSTHSTQPYKYNGKELDRKGQGNKQLQMYLKKLQNPATIQKFPELKNVNWKTVLDTY